eukprot:6800663-Ditylum_brightwellii.AAC.1
MEKTRVMTEAEGLYSTAHMLLPLAGGTWDDMEGAKQTAGGARDGAAGAGGGERWYSQGDGVEAGFRDGEGAGNGTGAATGWLR